jgi:hypothetical protein
MVSLLRTEVVSNFLFNNSKASGSVTLQSTAITDSYQADLGVSVSSLDSVNSHNLYNASCQDLQKT